MLQLVVSEPKGNQWQLALDADEYIVGRDKQAQVCLDDARISRRHARLWRDGERYMVEDLGSANGVRVDGEIITRPVPVGGGSLVEVGSYALRLVEAHAAPTAARFALRRLGVSRALARAYDLPAGTVDLGRGNESMICIDDPSLSRQHAVLQVGETVVVEDLHSSNGTFVNGHRVQRATLQAGDELRLGQVSLRLEAAGPGAAQAMAERARRDRRRRLGRGVAVALALAVLGAATWSVVQRGRSRRGRGRSEIGAYEAQVAALVKRGDAALAAQAWGEATAAFRQALQRDPISPSARNGLTQAEQEQAQAHQLAAATDALARAQPAAALDLLYSIEPNAYYGGAATALAERGRQALLAAGLGSANAACRAGQWSACQQAAAEVLVYVPQNVEAAALAEEAEEGLRSHHLSYTPWNPASEAHLPKAMVDPEVRAAVLRYASGDPEVAVRRLKGLAGRAPAAAALGLLAGLRRARQVGDNAASGGDWDAAMHGWEHAIGLDVQLVAGSPSSTGHLLRQRLVAQLLQRGNAAFDRGQLQESFALWHRANVLLPADAEVEAGLVRLEARAAALLDGTAASGAPDAASCGRLREVLAITRPLSAPHRAARGRLGRCR